MRVAVTVTDENGNIFQGQIDLAPTSPQKPTRKAATSKIPNSVLPSAVNFSSPIRAFVKKHARDMGGPQKFALLVGYLTKGETHKPVMLVEIEKQWNRMKPLLKGKFNLAYPTRAKENEWVDSPKRGTYVLLPTWKNILNA